MELKDSKVIQIQKAWFWYLIGFAFTAIAPFLFPPLTTMINDTTISGIMEIGVIVVQILLMVVVPLTIAASKLLTPQHAPSNPVTEMTVAIIVLVFGLLITFFGNFILTGLASAITGSFSVTIFWIGTIITWFLTVVATPLHTIIKAGK